MKTPETAKQAILPRLPVAVALALVMTAALMMVGCGDADADKGPKGHIEAITGATPGGTGPLTGAHLGFGMGAAPLPDENSQSFHHSQV
jgi:hypothetical protein